MFDILEIPTVIHFVMKFGTAFVIAFVNKGVDLKTI